MLVSPVPINRAEAEKPKSRKRKSRTLDEPVPVGGANRQFCAGIPMPNTVLPNPMTGPWGPIPIATPVFTSPYGGHPIATTMSWPRINYDPNYFAAMYPRFPVVHTPQQHPFMGPVQFVRPLVAYNPTLIQPTPQKAKRMYNSSRKPAGAKKSRTTKKCSKQEKSEQQDTQVYPQQFSVPISPAESGYSTESASSTSGGSNIFTFDRNQIDMSQPSSPKRSIDLPQLKHIPVLNSLIKQRLENDGHISRVSECRLCGSFSCGTDNVRTITTFMRSHLYTHVPTVFKCGVCYVYKANTMSRMRHHVRKFHDERLLNRAESIIDGRYEIDDKLTELAVRCFSSSVIQTVPRSSK